MNNNLNQLPQSVVRIKDLLPPSSLSGRAFITGSYAYGIPTEDSDIDLVVRCFEATGILLQELEPVSHNDQTVDYLYGPESYNLRFDNLNLIVCTSDRAYEYFSECTRHLVTECITNGPVSRDDAVAHFKKMKKEIFDESQTTTDTIEAGNLTGETSVEISTP